MNIHDLDGCAPVPLAHYLKALGILRLVTLQADEQARGWWQGVRFRLACNRTHQELLDFFLQCYAPTPLVSPWNKGSGFFYANDPALTPMEQSTAPRFALFRQGIVASRLMLGELTTADQAVRSVKEEAKDKKLTEAQKRGLKNSAEYKERLAKAENQFKALKTDLIPRLRLAWRGPHREWMDSAMVLIDDGSPQFPALLGTGGNDGRLDFTNNFMQRLNDVFDLANPQGTSHPAARNWFESALWGTAAIGCQSGSAVGQYLPGMAGGANASNGPDGNSLLNPADFLLMLEGAVLFAAHATRRLGTKEQSKAAAPFAVGSQGAGYASASESDENARGEQWMPLWNQPMNLAELRRILAEGRAQIGARSAREPLDLARAVARLGTARGINAFQRYGYIERNGQSNLAVPLGRFQVPEYAPPSLACLDDIDGWLSRLHRQARVKEASARLKQVERNLTDAIFAVLQHPTEPGRWQSVLICMSKVEAVLRTGSGFKAQPIPLLRSDWVAAADDGSPELRLALACALQSPGDPIRRHWLPLAGNRFASTGSGSQARIQTGSDVVIAGRNGIDDAIALVTRRMIEAGQSGERRLPLFPARHATAHPSDLARLLAGKVNIDLTIQLACALMALNGRRWRESPYLSELPAVDEYPDDAWLAVRLAMLPWPLREGSTIGADPATVRRLESGDAAAAVDLALQRLRAAGIHSTVRVSNASPANARLWAAALAFPISKNTAIGFLHRLDPNTLKEKRQ
ncbi:MAG: type I-U CRISPR-associated protein Csx17 [Syntrophobacteraceae bacterium]